MDDGRPLRSDAARLHSRFLPIRPHLISAFLATSPKAVGDPQWRTGAPKDGRRRPPLFGDTVAEHDRGVCLRFTRHGYVYGNYPHLEPEPVRSVQRVTAVA